MDTNSDNSFILTEKEFEAIETHVKPYAWNLGRLLGLLLKGEDIGECGGDS